ncbi:MAG: hypothetical protein Q9157_001164 [Trypethelium eluteriae]
MLRVHSQPSASDSPSIPPMENEYDRDQCTKVSAFTDQENTSNYFNGVDNLGNLEPFTAFYSIFYPNHPFLLPRVPLMQMLERRHLPHLELAIQYIGSHYISAASSNEYSDTLSSCLAQQGLPRDGFMVQSLLLFAMGLHLSAEVERSARYLESAITLALELGMHQLSFAQHNAGNSPMAVESWRRTWWELYIIDGLAASMNPSRLFRTWGVSSDVYLPCEDVSYFSEVSSLTRAAKAT